MRSLSLMICLISLCSSTVLAAVYSPRISHESERDEWSLPHVEKAFNPHRAEVLSRFLTGQISITPYSPREGTEKLATWSTVTDPAKLALVYGLADRAAIADAFAALWDPRHGAVRIVELSESPCVLVEIESNGRWGVIDPASQAVFTADHRKLSTWDEVIASPPLWDRLPAETLFPHADRAATREAWSKSKLTRRAARGSASHTPSYFLRRGERFTRFAKPQGERWQLTDAEQKDKPRVAFWNEVPRGPKAAQDGPAGYAHGRFEYEPSLKDDGSDVRDGADALQNVTVTADGLTLTKAGEGSAIFRVASPFPIVGLVGKIEDAKDDKEASVVEIDATGATLSYSKDFGATWLTLETKTWPAKVDLTAQVAGEYSYQFRIELKGKPGEAIVRSLKMTTWVQCSPLSFPRLTTGENNLVIGTSDSMDRPTRAMVIKASTADENDFLRPVIHPPKDYRPGDAKERVVGPFTMRIAAPPGEKIAWLQLGGRFATKPDSLEPESVTWGVATGSPQNFEPIKFGRLAAEMDTVYVPVDPVPAVYCRVEGRPALNQLRVTAHCLDNDRSANSPWRIIHRWKANNEPREHTVEVQEPTSYTVPVTDEVPSDQSVEFIVPGSLAR